jgi:hypothetical protein
LKLKLFNNPNFLRTAFFRSFIPPIGNILLKTRLSTVWFSLTAAD